MTKEKLGKWFFVATVFLLFAELVIIFAVAPLRSYIDYIEKYGWDSQAAIFIYVIPANITMVVAIFYSCRMYRSSACTINKDNLRFFEIVSSGLLVSSIFSASTIGSRDSEMDLSVTGVWAISVIGSLFSLVLYISISSYRSKVFYEFELDDREDWNIKARIFYRRLNLNTREFKTSLKCSVIQEEAASGYVQSLKRMKHQKCSRYSESYGRHLGNMNRLMGRLQNSHHSIPLSDTVSTKEKCTCGMSHRCYKQFFRFLTQTPNDSSKLSSSVR